MFARSSRTAKYREACSGPVSEQCPCWPGERSLWLRCKATAVPLETAALVSPLPGARVQNRTPSTRQPSCPTIPPLVLACSLEKNTPHKDYPRTNFGGYIVWKCACSSARRWRPLPDSPSLGRKRVLVLSRGCWLCRYFAWRAMPTPC